jgi:hypothetical protein
MKEAGHNPHQRIAGSSSPCDTLEDFGLHANNCSSLKRIQLMKLPLRYQEQIAAQTLSGRNRKSVGSQNASEVENQHANRTRADGIES